MQNTTNLGLKKPDYTDFADIQDINDNMDALDEALHDTQNSVATFTSSDVADGSATSWTTVPKLSSGETHKSIFAKISQMFKNIRYLYKLLGTTDISSIGNGTVTNALSVLNANVRELRTLKPCTVNLANANQISHIQGEAYCYYLSPTYVVVFCTLAFRTNTARTAGSAVFYLTVDNKTISIFEPYDMTCVMTTDNVMRFAGYNFDDHKYFVIPSAWAANKDARYSGVFCGTIS